MQPTPCASAGRRRPDAEAGEARCAHPLEPIRIAGLDQWRMQIDRRAGRIMHGQKRAALRGGGEHNELIDEFYPEFAPFSTSQFGRVRCPRCGDLVPAYYIVLDTQRSPLTCFDCIV